MQAIINESSTFLYSSIENLVLCASSEFDDFARRRDVRFKAHGARHYLIWLRRQYAWLSRSHYVVEVIDHRYRHTLDMVNNLLEDLVTVVRPSDGCKPE
jgi:hypothetical protein